MYFNGLVGLAILVHAGDVFLYPGFLQNWTGTPPWPITLILAGLILGLRLWGKIQLSDKLVLANQLLFLPAGLTLTILMHLAETFIFTNVVLAYTRIHLPAFSDLSLCLVILSLVMTKFSLVLKHWRWYVFSGGITLFALKVFMNWYLEDWFKLLDKEDGLSEYTSFLLILTSSLLAGWSAWQLRASPLTEKIKRFWIAGLVMSTLVWFIIAGEEISWGQRILGLETPESIEAVNKQDELNLHNHQIVFQYVYYAYLVLGIYAVVSETFLFCSGSVGKWLYQRCLPVISPWFMAPFFGPMIGYVIWRYGSGLNNTYDVWEEAAELFLSFGIFGWYSYRAVQIRQVAAQPTAKVESTLDQLAHLDVDLPFPTGSKPTSSV